MRFWAASMMTSVLAAVGTHVAFAMPLDLRAELVFRIICLLRFRKIPFTCSWLPSKSHFHLASPGAFGLLLVAARAATLERQALLKTGRMVAMPTLLATSFLLHQQVRKNRSVPIPLGPIRAVPAVE
jgi:hypothetical protein